MADTASQTVYRARIERRFAASRERVFRAWASAEALKRWYAPGEATVALAEVDFRVGGRFLIHMQGPDGTAFRVSGEYREIVPPERLVFTWRWEHEPAEAETVVTVEFRENGAETDVILTHDGFASAQAQTGHETGWNGIFEKLAALLSDG